MSYTDEQLEALLDDLESDRVERKELWSGDAPNKAREAVCTFANDLPDHRKPGVLFVGARDNGAPSGLPITGELLRTLADMKTDANILPPPTLIAEKRVLKGRKWPLSRYNPLTRHLSDSKEKSGFVPARGAALRPHRTSVS